MKEVIIAFAALALAAAGCFEDVPPPRGDRVEATTPAPVLTNVAASFNQRDINLLKAMLSENFVFYFDPRDVGQTAPGGKYIIPESWSYTEFWQAVNNMFTTAYSIDVKIPTHRVGTPSENETTYRADNIPISLLVMVDEMYGYLSDHGYCNFEFEKYEAASGNKYWRLIGWWDRTSAYLDESTSVVPPSVGMILAYFR